LNFVIYFEISKVLEPAFFKEKEKIGTDAFIGKGWR
jgi:hypothetical protein